VLGIFCFASHVSAQTISVDDSWINLSHVSHRSTLTFAEKNGVCESGTVSKVDDSSVTIVIADKKQLQLRKDKLLQVGEGGAHNLVYSARSSWSDVSKAAPGHAESLLVVAMDGKKYSGKPISVSDTSIVLKTLTTTETISKRNTSTVIYVRQKPLTDSEEYFAQEAPFLLLFSPTSYVRAAGISLKLKVRLYEARMQEDNSEIICNPSTSPKL
jgi:hypothetical protein